MKSRKEWKKLRRLCFILCVVMLMAMDILALAVTMGGIYACSDGKITGKSKFAWTYDINLEDKWFVNAKEVNSGIFFHATVLCTYNNGFLGLGKKDSCQIIEVTSHGVCAYAGVQCGGGTKYTSVSAGQFKSSTATVSHDGDDTIFRIVFGTIEE